MNKLITIIDVAQEARVSKSTVSLVMAGSTSIKEETSSRVRSAAEKLGYVYNRRAAGLRTKTSNIVGVLITDLMNPFFAEILIGIERRLVEAGYIVMMAHTNESSTLQLQVMRSMREQNVAGILICPVQSTQPTDLVKMRALNVPFVVLVRSLGSSGYDFVGADYKLGFYQATSHLLEAGHQRIAFVGAGEGEVFEQRLSGYEQALQERQIQFDASLVVKCEATREGGYAGIQKVLEQAPTPTAAVCYNDITAFGALWALGERGLRPGVDFSITGADNITDAAHSNPPLSTIDTEPRELGNAAATTLLSRIKNPDGDWQHLVSSPHFLVRQSG